MVVVCYLLLFFVLLLLFICRTSRRKHVSQKFTPPPVNSESSTLPLNSTSPSFQRKVKPLLQEAIDAIPSQRRKRTQLKKTSKMRKRRKSPEGGLVYLLSLGCRRNFERGCLAISRTKNSCPSRRGRGPLTSTGVLLPELSYWMEPVCLMVGSVPLLEHPP